MSVLSVVADTTKVRIFKQITTNLGGSGQPLGLLLIPQRYEFSSKSQPTPNSNVSVDGCCWYHKGTNFQANHNAVFKVSSTKVVVADTTKVRIFKQITTFVLLMMLLMSCCWYHKGTNFQANHNSKRKTGRRRRVVADTTKVRIFKQITTCQMFPCSVLLLLLIPQRYEFSSKSQQSSVFASIKCSCCWYHKGTNFQANHNTPFRLLVMLSLLLIPQRYEFSSKSQQAISWLPILEVVADTTKVRIFKQITTLPIIGKLFEGCCWYHKGTNFQANHNSKRIFNEIFKVVADTTKVRIFKQITTADRFGFLIGMLLLIPQRYEFSSKSQLEDVDKKIRPGCCWYHKGTNFQANHNDLLLMELVAIVVADTTKVRIFKQITTVIEWWWHYQWLLLIPQRYEFSSKSQLCLSLVNSSRRCCWYHKGTNFQANHNYK